MRRAILPHELSIETQRDQQDICRRMVRLSKPLERCVHSNERNLADWRSTRRYARVTGCTPNYDINRLRTPQNQIGTAFGTARFIWLSLSADDASLFWRVGPIHHGRDRKAKMVDFQYFFLFFKHLSNPPRQLFGVVFDCFVSFSSFKVQHCRDKIGNVVRHG